MNDKAGWFHITLAASLASTRVRIAELEQQLAQATDAAWRHREGCAMHGGRSGACGCGIVIAAGLLRERDAATAERDSLRAQLQASEAGAAARLKVLGLDQPYPFHSIFNHLIDAVTHMFDHHDCDTQGWEVWHSALSKAKKMRPALLDAFASDAGTALLAQHAREIEERDAKIADHASEIRHMTGERDGMRSWIAGAVADYDQLAALLNVHGIDVWADTADAICSLVAAKDADLAAARRELEAERERNRVLDQMLRLDPPDFLGLADRLRAAKQKHNGEGYEMDVADVVLVVRDWLAAPAAPPSEEPKRPDWHPMRPMIDEHGRCHDMAVGPCECGATHTREHPAPGINAEAFAKNSPSPPAPATNDKETT